MDILLVGGGGHCRAVIDVIERTGRFRIAGIVDASKAKGEALDGYEILGADADLPALRRLVPAAIVTVGQIRSPDIRIRLHATLVELGYDLPVVVCPSAEVSRRAQVAAGSVVMHLAFVGPGASIGRNCIVNNRAHVEHDCAIGDHCHISTGAILNGHVSVGGGTLIGSGSVVRETLKVGERCIVAMGSRLFKPLEDGGIHIGGARQ